MGLEHYGGSASSSDVEVLLVCMEVLEELGVADFQINLGSVDFFGGIVDRMNLPEEDIDQLKGLLNIKDQTGLERLLDGLSFESGGRTFYSQSPI